MKTYRAKYLFIEIRPGSAQSLLKCVDFSTREKEEESVKRSYRREKERLEGAVKDIVEGRRSGKICQGLFRLEGKGRKRKEVKICD